MGVLRATAKTVEESLQPVSQSGAERRRCYDQSVATIEETLVTLTATAAAKIRELQAEEPAGEAEVLRVAIQGGGCSGFQYGLGFDRGSQEGDHEFVSEGVTVV